MALVVDGAFEWDSEKAMANPLDHDGVTFPEAIPAILDPFAIEDEDATGDEERLDVIGSDASGRVLFVVTVERGERIRIISARKAEPGEVRRYQRSREQ